MRNKKGLVGVVALLAVTALAPGLCLAEKRVLSGDELRALITDKTVQVTRAKDGAQWKVYFGADGKSLSSDTGEGSWEVNGSGEHCNSGVRLKCAKVADNGDGSYARLKPNGDVAVTWTTIVDGKDL